jgi:hypothetical protein
MQAGGAAAVAFHPAPRALTSVSLSLSFDFFAGGLHCFLCIFFYEMNNDLQHGPRFCGILPLKANC